MPEDESEGEGDDAAGSNAEANGRSGDITPNGSSDSRARKFIPPLEVELQMKLLWKEEATVLNLVFNAGEKGAESAPPERGYKLFFVSALAVPPPRFRPPMHLGDVVAEHPQNVYLNKVRDDPGVDSSFGRESSCTLITAFSTVYSALVEGNTIGSNHGLAMIP